MPPAATPPPTNTQPPPTLQPHGDGPVVTQPLPGDRDGLYGGTLNNAESDRDKMISLPEHPPRPGQRFRRSPQHRPHPVLERRTPAHRRRHPHLPTRTHPHRAAAGHPSHQPRIRRNPPHHPAIGLPNGHRRVRRRPRGTPRPPLLRQPPYRADRFNRRTETRGHSLARLQPGALAAVQPSSAAITNFVLVDVVTGQPFNRPAGTTGDNDTPHTQPVPPPAPASNMPTTGQGTPLDIDGTYAEFTMH